MSKFCLRFAPDVAAGFVSTLIDPLSVLLFSPLFAGLYSAYSDPISSSLCRRGAMILPGGFFSGKYWFIKLPLLFLLPDRPAFPWRAKWI